MPKARRKTPRKFALILAGTLGGLVAALAFALAMPAAPTSADPQLDSDELAFVTLINNYRAQNGLGPLSIDWEMQASSDWMSTDMGQKAYFSHTDSLGRDPWTRMCDFGYCYNTWMGENIAAGFSTAQSVFTAWQNSPGHNANMLGANYNAMGISKVCTTGSPYNCYWTNDFGGVNSGSLPPAGATATPTPSPTPSRAPTASPTPTRTATPQRHADQTHLHTTTDSNRTPTPSPTPTLISHPTATPTSTAPAHPQGDNTARHAHSLRPPLIRATQRKRGRSMDRPLFTCRPVTRRFRLSA